jgi:predicted aminopeptidase
MASCLPIDGCYLVKQGIGLLSSYSGARDIDQWLANPALTKEERAFLLEAKDIRSFAHESLGLAESGNYSSYVRLNRDYLANVVSACAEDSFNQYLWDYPLLGPLPYKGFFDIADARAEARRLKEAGYDVMLRPVDAFSTLGFFRDPLFSFMRGYSTADLADLIIHESTHATLFIKGQADFDENLALFEGGVGGIEYVARRFGADSKELALAKADRRDAERYRVFLGVLAKDLGAMYAATKDGDERLARKAQIIQAFRDRYRDDWAKGFETEVYKGLWSRPIDNAYIATFQNYNSGQDDFRACYEACGSDLKAFMAYLLAMPSGADPWAYLRAKAPVPSASSAAPSATAAPKSAP